jgi:hypothetical protein
MHGTGEKNENHGVFRWQNFLGGNSSGTFVVILLFDKIYPIMD